jgi:hypothetical protein
LNPPLMHPDQEDWLIPKVNEQSYGRPGMPFSSAPRVLGLGRLEHSYAEVVKQKIKFPCGSLVPPTSPVMQRRRTVVRFKPFPTVTVFQGDMPPCSLGCKVASWGPKTCRPKTSPVSILKNHGIRSSSRPSGQLDGRERTAEQAWQLVRRKHWWRRLRKDNSTPYFVRSAARSQKFKQKALGRCYNCLASDHLVTQCKGPTRCWKCKAFGHISSSCNGGSRYPVKHRPLPQLKLVGFKIKTSNQGTQVWCCLNRSFSIYITHVWCYLNSSFSIYIALYI